MVIAIKEKDKVVIGYSNLDNWNRLADKDYVDEENLAIKFSKSGNLFACSDMNRRADLLLYDDELLSMDVSPKYIVKEIIPYVKEKLIANDATIKEDNWENALVICNDEHIYDIGPRFCFCEVDDYVCHGYKVETLKSVLDETKNLSAEERIIKAASFASLLHKESLFPFVITDTKGKQLKIIYEGENK